MVPPLSVLHPLYAADLRVRRAGRNVATLRRQLRRWANAHRDAYRTRVRPDGSVHVEMTGQWAVYHLLPLASVTIGETVYNLRAALDYLIFEIARANNGGKNVSGTQFPIESSEETYWARSTGKTPDGKRVAQYLRKVPKPVVADLAQYQPF